MLWMNIKMAFAALRSSKARSLLTMLGVIIGVTSVVTVVSIGEGVKDQVNGEINRLGSDLVTVTPGNAVTRNDEGDIEQFNPTASFGAITITESDLNVIKNTDNVEFAAPISTVPGSVTSSSDELENTLTVATEPRLADALNRQVEVGSFLSDSITNKYAAVVSYDLAQEYLGGKDAALGRKLTIRSEEFTVIGVMQEEETSVLQAGFNLNRAIYIPFDTGIELNNDTAFILRIFARISDVNQIDSTVTRLTEEITKNHGGEEDFSVIKQEETLQITDSVLSLVTTFVAGIAGISLFVGGIGIMNIMLAAVTERTYETGIRKSIGATNSQIRSQFLIESVVLSVIGGIIGVLLSLAITVGFRTYTDLEPKVTLPIVIIATTASTIVGVIFGTLPAIKASRKNPIEALRRI